MVTKRDKSDPPLHRRTRRRPKKLKSLRDSKGRPQMVDVEGRPLKEITTQQINSMRDMFRAHLTGTLTVGSGKRERQVPRLRHIMETLTALQEDAGPEEKRVLLMILKWVEPASWYDRERELRDQMRAEVFDELMPLINRFVEADRVLELAAEIEKLHRTSAAAAGSWLPGNDED